MAMNMHRGRGIATSYVHLCELKNSTNEWWLLVLQANFYWEIFFCLNSLVFVANNFKLAVDLILNRFSIWY